MNPKLVMGFVVEALDGRILDGAVHPLDLTIGPRVPGLGQAMMLLRAHATSKAGAQNGSPRSSMPLISATDQLPPLGIGEVSPIVGQHGMDLVGYRVDEVQQEVGCDPPCGLLVQLGDGEL